MSPNFLKLNSIVYRKTEFMLLHPVSCKINELSNIQMNVSGHVIKLSDSVMNLHGSMSGSQF